MPSTGSRLSGSRWKRQLRSSCSGPVIPIEIASSRPSSRRTIIARFAHGHARATISRYRPAATGHRDEPSAVMRSSMPTGARTKAPCRSSSLMPRGYPLPRPVDRLDGQVRGEARRGRRGARPPARPRRSGPAPGRAWTRSSPPPGAARRSAARRRAPRCCGRARRRWRCCPRSPAPPPASRATRSTTSTSRSAEPVGAVGHARGGHRVGHGGHPVRARGPHHVLPQRGVHVHAVGDQLDGHAVVVQQRDDRTGLAVVQRGAWR